MPSSAKGSSPAGIALSRRSRAILAVVRPLAGLAKRLGWQPYAEECSRCRTDLPVGDAYYVGGRRLCTACAERARRGMLRALWGFAALTVVAVAAAIVAGVEEFRRAGHYAWQFVPMLIGIALLPIACAWVGMRFMKMDNRDFQAREDLIAQHKALTSRLAESNRPS